jgi:hypothetical protein
LSGSPFKPPALPGVSDYPGSDSFSDKDYDAYTGSITDGQLSLTLKTPTSLHTASTIENNFFSEWDSVTVSPSSAKGLVIDSFIINDYGYTTLRRSYYTKNSSSSSSESVIYVYVDTDEVTITGKGKTTEYFSTSKTIKDFDLTLKRGWNTVYQSEKGSYSEGSAILTIELKVANPINLRWVRG